MENGQNITFDALKGFIEAHRTFREDIAQGRVLHKCEDFSLDYSLDFQKAGIEHAVLEARDHEFLAVRTADRGIVLFDPTFRQFYPEHPAPYFIGSAEELLAVANQKGLDHTLQVSRFPQFPGDSITARHCFLDATMTLHLASPHAFSAGREQLQPWLQALAPIHPHSHAANLGLRAAQARSSSDVSP